MKAPFTLITLTLCALTLGCSKESAANVKEDGAQAANAQPAAEVEDGCAGCMDSMAESATALEEDAMAKGMTLTEFTPISKILAAPEEFEGKRVLIKGDAVAVCEKRGCWINLMSEADNSKYLRVKVNDGEIVFPVEVKGHEVTAEGVIEKVVYSIETLRTAYAKQAEAKGEEFDPESVTEPRIVWQLKGLGAKWES